MGQAVSVLSSVMYRMADSERASRFFHGSLTRPLVDRFVAGETVDAAIAETRALNSNRMEASLDLLGENVTDNERAEAYTTAYIDILRRIEQERVQSNISVKLTMIGLDISNDKASENIERIAAAAHERNNFVRIDMESSAYTSRTLQIFRDVHDRHPESVGIVLQSYLYRTDEDVEEMIERQARVRIVKGAYKEPDTVAYPRKDDVDMAYSRHIKRLLDAANYPAIATQDPAMVQLTKEHATASSIPASRFEFQMMYGIARSLQVQLAEERYNVRIYVPFGEEWYPYFTRRLAERPANMLFLARSLVKR
jgi:proline dehydrogenase